MRNLLLLVIVGILSIGVWTATAGEGASGHGSMHGPPGHHGLPGRMPHGGGHAGDMGIFFPSVPAQQFMESIAGEPGPAPAHLALPTGGLVVGGSEHMIAGHMVGPAIHPHTHPAVRAEAGMAVSSQVTASSDDESDQAAMTTAQPNPPIASPLPPRPPGAGGPGRRVSGWSSPGLPGPGRPPSPR
jgi:hypothetical protein